jgi:hypothetical protein
MYHRQSIDFWIVYDARPEFLEKVGEGGLGEVQ